MRCFRHLGTSAGAQVTYFGLHSLQHRGQEGRSILANDGAFTSPSRNRADCRSLQKSSRLRSLDRNGAIGHVRYATSGSASINNIQPFLFDFADMQVGLAHNGNLTNAVSLKAELEKWFHFLFFF